VAKAIKSKKNEESRRVGHDFYDLLIEEALVDPTNRVLSVIAWQLRATILRRGVYRAIVARRETQYGEP
jgi:hypothetical protein